MRLDTAALALHLGCTAGMVRLMVHDGVIAPIGTVRLHRYGRRALLFDVDTVEGPALAYLTRRRSPA